VSQPEPAADAPPSTWLITGTSGAGKTTALRALEARGLRCIDNLPLELLPSLAASVDGVQQAAIVDARQGVGLGGFRPVPGVRVLYIDAADDVLVRRLAESVRPHPCAAAGGSREAIAAERSLLTALRAAADAVVDSSALTPTELADRVVELVRPAEPKVSFLCTVSSFGYKFSPPLDADWVVDARVLRNPFWVPELRPLTGHDAAVRDYVLGQETATELLDRLGGLFGWVTPRLVAHGRNRFHIAVGCTGGRHRSVVLAEALAERLAGQGIAVVVRHRDIEKPDPR
jgi:UPF0042 nucleotide-binding protein